MAPTSGGDKAGAIPGGVGEMNLYIMSRGRPDKQFTLKNLPPSWYERTYLVVPEHEYLEYVRHNPHIKVAVAPETVTNYSQKFQYILDGLPYSDVFNNRKFDTNDKAVILDDDLVFSQKNSEGKLISVKDPEQNAGLFEMMEQMLEKVPLVGVHPRQMGQNAKQPFVWNGRVICIQGINRKLIGVVKVDDLPILADVVLNCTLLSRGQPNALITTYFQDHGPCQAPGGCSIYRTPEMQRNAAEYIAKRFTPFAKTVIRKPKVAKWMGDERVEFQVQWKKMYENGLAMKEKFGETYRGL